MISSTPAIQTLVKCFMRLPGIGRRTAERLAYHLLNVPEDETIALGQAILQLRTSVSVCELCFNLAEGSQCGICQDVQRDVSIICVVEEAKDIFAIEKAGSFHGVYHVLQGAISPLEGVGPEQLTILQLQDRLSNGVTEVIIATDSDTDGETTALYLQQRIKDSGVIVTRIAYGLPIGSDLEYADAPTLAKALEGRRAF